MKKLSLLFAACAVAVGAVTAGAQTLALQLQAANYNPTTGVWSDSSGNGDTATFTLANIYGTDTGPIPSLQTGVTPNGSPAVDLTGHGSLLLSTPIGYSSGYTVFAFAKPFAGTGRNALTGGTAPNALEYDIYNGPQDYLEEYTSDVGHGNATISTSSFSLIDLAVNSSGASFRLNGSSDGSVAGGTFGSAITRIGNNEGGGDGFVGDVSEIDIYTGVLNAGQISTVEAALTAEYVSPVPEPTSLAMLAGGSGLLLAFRRFRRA